MTPETKLCPKCGKTKPVDSKHWNKHSTRAGGLQHACKDCTKASRQGSGPKTKRASHARLYESTQRLLDIVEDTPCLPSEMLLAAGALDFALADCGYVRTKAKRRKKAKTKAVLSEPLAESVPATKPDKNEAPIEENKGTPATGDAHQEVPTSAEATETAKHCLYNHFMAVGLGQNDIPEAMEMLTSPRWAGGPHRMSRVDAAARQLAMRARGAPDPGGVIMDALRTESADQDGLAPIPTQEPIGDAVLDDEPKKPSQDTVKSKQHTKYSEQLLQQAKSIEQSRPEEAAALRETAKAHQSAAKALA